ncbi:hypothetical protein LWC35_20555 [Pseudonocardia kujensis]|uniref:hypothetical protein n=1 Tax=Pseudonocardia kujensis TaxID=1128675 RepID=UPI001E2DF4DF|nr:hypothetical protein [Pseudonocardia kujensis]MCE0765275.1 hypothetical protein [Pseudonocardia kujensis]
MTAGAVGRTAIAGTVLAALSGSTMTAVSLSSADTSVPLPTFAAAPATAPDLPTRPAAAPEPAGAGVVDGGTLAAIALTPAIAAAQPVRAPAPAVTPAVPVAHRQSAVVERRPGQARQERVRRAVAERLSPDTRANIRRACGMGVLDGNLCRLG